MRYKILIVNKSSSFVDSCKDTFHKKGWQVEVCPSGILAVRKMYSFEPDLILVGQETQGCHPLTALNNISGAPISKNFSVVFFATPEFFKQHEGEAEKWKAPLRYFVKLPLDDAQFCRFCDSLMNREKAEVIETAYKGLLFDFETAEITNSQKLPQELSKELNLPPIKKTKSKLVPAKVGSKKKVVKKIRAAKIKKADSDEFTTLKNYVAMKEHELGELEADFRRAKEQLEIAEKKGSQLDYDYKKMASKHEEFQDKIGELKQENEELKGSHERVLKSHEQEARTKSDRILMLEKKCETAQKRIEEVKARVKKDIQSIRVKERELEAKLEILKRDSETLIAAKDRKLLELKRKIDGLEYEIESVSEKEQHAEAKVKFWKERIERVLRALKLGTSLLESEEDAEFDQEAPTIPPKKTHKAA